jgi:16S rRNA (cytidine1402-2'-O)-methyltransferase
MLYVVATPIGNLKDITLRALDALRESDFIFCEDTRRSINLLNYYQIRKPLFRYSDHIKKSAQKIIELISAGKKVSLISDGGIPNISDPGLTVLKMAIEKGLKVEIVGGVSAVTNAMSLSGFDGSSFLFLGFVERADLRILKSIQIALSFGIPVVLFESPNRLIYFLELINKNFPSTDVVIAREMSKVYEEWTRGKIYYVLNALRNREIKGEITVVLNRSISSDKNIKSIGFVCSGNTCRSVMAHHYFRKILIEKNINIEVSSAGIMVRDKKTSDEVVDILKQNGVENINHTPLQLDKKFIDKNDLILVMTKEHKKILNAFFPESFSKIYTLNEYSGVSSGDIYDPYGRSYYDYEITFKNIKKACDKLIESLLKKS